MLNKFKRGIAALLSLILIIGAVQLPAFAAVAEHEGQAQEEQATQEAIPASIEETRSQDEEMTADEESEQRSPFYATPESLKPSGMSKRSENLDLEEFLEYFKEKMASCPESIDISRFKFQGTQAVFDILCEEIFHKMPEAFHINGMEGKFTSDGQYLGSLQPKYRTYCDTASVYAQCYTKMINGAQTLLAGVDWDALTDVNKALLLHDRLAIWADYDYDNAYPSTPKDKIFTAYSILGEQLGVCQGYAMAYMYLLDQVGVKSGYVSSDDIWHGWNVVYIGDVAYHVDVTWDDGPYNRLGQVRHENFLLSSNAMIQTGHIGEGKDTTDWEYFCDDSVGLPTDTRFENYYWKESDTAFQYLGGKIYYINTVEEMLYVIEGANHRALRSVESKWYYTSGWYYDELAKLASVGSKLLFNTNKTIEAYDVVTGQTTTVYAPSLSTYNNIYGFKYENGKIICDIADTANYSKPIKQLSAVYTPTCGEHSYTVLKSETKPTCTTQGTAVYKCAYCAETKTTYTNKLGHSFTNYKSNNNATCTKDGTKTAKCDRCSVTDTKADTGSKLGHNYKKTSGSATCTVPGTATYTCTRCGDSYTETSGSALGHSFTNYKSNNNATCTKDGTETAKCDRCSVTNTRTDTGSALGHSFTKYVSNKDGTCQKDGTQTAKCDRCTAQNTITEPNSKTDHKWNSGVYVEGSAEVEGYTLYTCTVCGETKKVIDTTTAQITGHPVAVTTDSGNTAYFTVSTRGVIRSYQWQYRKIYKWYDTTMTGYNTDTLTVTATGARNGYDYRCVITFKNGKVLYTDPAELTVNTVISITSDPKNQTIALGGKAQFTAAASGESIKYQWQYCRPGSEKWIDTTMEGATKATVLIGTTTARNGYQYRCKLTDVAGTVAYTDAATLTVLSITKQPAAVTKNRDETAIFTVTTNVTGDFTYQWQYSKNGTTWTNTTMTGYNTATLEVVATKARNGYLYRCVLTDCRSNTLTTNAVQLTVKTEEVTPEPEVPEDPAVVTAQPKSATALLDGNAKFAVKATGAAAYMWQYSKNGTTWNETAMTGYNTATLTVAAAENRNGYQYRCVVTGEDGAKVYSDAATLTLATVSQQPENVTGFAGGQVKFSVKLSDTGDIRYQWQYRKSSSAAWTATSMTGCNTKTLTVAVTAARNGYEYCCKLTDSFGNTLLTEAAVLSAVALSQHPVDRVTVLNGNAVFTAAVTEPTAVSYRWQYRRTETAGWTDTSLDGYNTEKLTVKATAARNGYQYRCVFTDAAGNEVCTDAATLQILTITRQPVSAGTAPGGTVVMAVETNLSSDITYRWQYSKDGTKWINTTMTGYDTAALQVKATTARNGYQYRCVITDACGNELLSGAATLSVLTITEQPVSMTAEEGQTVQLTVGVNLTEGFAYRWQYSRDGIKWYDTTLTGYNTNTLQVEATTARDGYQYRCVILIDGKVVLTSGAATLTVTVPEPEIPLNPAVITSQPENASAFVGGSAQFTVTATGAVSYQWQYRRSETANWTSTSMTGYNTDTLTVGVTAARNGYQYRCVITGEDGVKVCTDAATLGILEITEQPVVGYGFIGSTSEFTVTVSDATDISYQWQYSKDGTKWINTAMTGYKTDTLTVEVTAARNGYRYRCILTDAFGNTLESDGAELCIVKITEQPADQTVSAGGTAVFMVAVSDSELVSYQWQYRRSETAKWTNTTMDGFDTDCLCVEVTTARNGYQYRCVLKMANGSTLDSDFATLTVG